MTKTNCYNTDACNLLLNCGERFFVNADKLFVEQESSVEYCYLLVSGIVVSTEITETGIERIYNIFNSGSLLLESNLLSSTPTTLGYKALSKAEMIKIDRKSLLSAMRESEDVMLFVMNNTADKLESAINRIRENVDHDAEWKVYNILATLAVDYGKQLGDWIKIELKISQQVLSNMLMVNRVTVTKAINKMKEDNTVQFSNGYYYLKTTDMVG